MSQRPRPQLPLPNLNNSLRHLQTVESPDGRVVLQGHVRYKKALKLVLMDRSIQASVWKPHWRGKAEAH